MRKLSAHSERGMPNAIDVAARPVRVSLAGANALVTGGAGFIGSHLVEALIDAGARHVHVLDDLSLGSRAHLADALAHPDVELTVGDAADLGDLEQVAVERGPFDLCFNLAVLPLPHSLVKPAANVARNVAMTTAICELGRAGAYRRLIQFSSSEVYGSATAANAMDEEHRISPHTPYAAAKAATDLIALSYATTFRLNVVIVRPFNTYGERQSAGAYAGLIPAVVRAVLAGEPVTIYGDGAQTRDMMYVADTVRGALLAATCDAVGTAFNLGSGVEVTVDHMVRLLLSGMGQPGYPVIYAPPRPGDVRRLLADATRARDQLGFMPCTSLDVGLQRTIDWYITSAQDAA
jgi:UDP-glucose 4-epimerase